MKGKKKKEKVIKYLLITWINNKINETNTLEQIDSLFDKIYFNMAFKIWKRVKAGYFTW